jgi:predicted peptidase
MGAVRHPAALLFLSFLSFAPPLALAEAERDRGTFAKHEVRLPSGGTARFQVWLPPGFTKEVYWPAILFLHGREESGSDNERQIEVGLGPALRARPDGWPFVVVFPQKPDADVLWSAREDLAMAALAQARALYPIDVHRIYLTGLSQGGEGTWGIAAAQPKTFAALVPVCGWSERPAEAARAIGGTPVWLFHGRKDEVVPPEAAQKIAAALQREGHPPRITLYGDTGHDSWDRAYRTRNLPRWLLKRRR